METAIPSTIRTNRPSGAPLPVAVPGALALILCLLAFLAWPLAAQAQSQAQAPADAPAETDTAAPEVTIVDPADVLSESDEQGLVNDTTGIAFPAEVQAVRYLTFAENDENFNDTIENYLRDNHPDWIQDNSFAPGELIVAVGMDPRKHGVYCGNDVCSAVDFYGEGRQEAILDSMVGPFRDSRFAIGLYEGAAAAADPEVRQIDEPTPGWVWVMVGSVCAAVAAIVGGMSAFVVGKNRKKKAQTAREHFDRVQREYGDVAQRLDAIDVRANSLSSPLANDKLRREWDDIHTRFLGLNTTFDQLDGLTHDSDDKAFRAKADVLENADTTITQMDTAEQNIDILYEMEHGDETTRRRELSRLRDDIAEARLEVNEKDTVLDDTLSEILTRIDDADVTADDFMDFYARLLTDYTTALNGVQSHMKKVKETTEREAPTLYDDNWRVGTGYNSFVPFYMISTWHAADVSAAQSAASASSSSVNTSFSSGFSGGGASGSW